MTSNFLITESIKQLYPKNTCNRLIFQNENVLDFDNSIHKKYQSFEVIRSKWNDKKNILNSVKKIDLFYEEILKLFAINLNKIHNKNYSKRFWRIFIGPWVNNFLIICFEKWNDLETTIKTFKIDKTFFLDLDESIIASEHAHAMSLFANPYYKQRINQEILKNFLIPSQIINLGKIQESFKPWILTKESLFDKFISKIFNKKKKKYFIAYTGLKLTDNIFLNISLNQLPINYKFNNYKSFKFKNDSLRKKLLSNFQPKNQFEVCFQNLIIKEFPLCFLEDFNNFEKWSSKKLLPLNPKIIFSSFLLWKNSLSQYYIAKKTEEGTKLIYRQHGANFGAVEYATGEVHEKKACDKFLTWGWVEDKDKSKIEKSGVRFLKIKKITKKVKKIIVTLRSRKRHVQTIAIGAYGTIRYTDYLKFSQKFLLSLNENVVKKITLRFPPHIKDYNSQDFYNVLGEKFYQDNTQSFYDLILDDNFFLHTNHSTAFLETLAHNCPTIGVWDDKDFFLKKEYSKFYEEMKRVGIIHTDTIKAKNFINELNFEEINEWWQQKEIQNIKKEFVHNYVNTENFNFRNLKKLFLSL